MIRILEDRGPPPDFLFALLGFVPVVLVVGVIGVIVLIVVAATRKSASNGERSVRWLPLIYYYLATVIGLVITLTGVIGGVSGLVTAAFPRTGDEYIYSEPPYDDKGNPIKETPVEREERESEDLEISRQSGFAGGIRGGITAGVGAPVFVWHLRQARRKEPERD
ncbi:MAG TPA: hypothetical protein VFA34_16035 [Actinomycetota bacterium]|nr:hypothetical protein [Actinomycetota bacterium]